MSAWVKRSFRIYLCMCAIVGWPVTKTSPRSNSLWVTRAFSNSVGWKTKPTKMWKNSSGGAWKIYFGVGNWKPFHYQCQEIIMVLESWKITALRRFRRLELTYCLVRSDIYNRWYLTVNQLMLVKTATSSIKIVNRASLTSTGKGWHEWHMSSDRHPATVSENVIKRITLLVIDPSPVREDMSDRCHLTVIQWKRRNDVKGIRFGETAPSPSKGWHERQVSPTVGI